MTTINDMLVPTGPLGRWELWTNRILGALNGSVKTRIPVAYEETEWQSEDGQIWHCAHAETEFEELTVNPDESATVEVCKDCGAQNLNGEWYE